MTDAKLNVLHKFPHQILTAVPFTSVSIKDRFWSGRMRASQKTTLASCVTQCDNTGRITNFAKSAGLIEGEFEGLFYNDSDVYKVLEGIAYSLMVEPDAKLESDADRIIDLIAAAQQEDGYLQTYFMLKEPNKKWTDMNMHEEYCAGHMIEAAIAFKQATGKRKLLDTAIRFADLIDSLFGPNKRHWVAGHQEIELALVKLYAETGETRYWKLAFWLLEERGNGHGVGYSWVRDGWGAAYNQDDVPVREITKVTGHAVRAMYMYAGMTDIAALTGDGEYLRALDRIWSNVVNRNMYITGGIGPSHNNEGFSEDFDLPNDTAYCETCASVGMVLWNHRMNLLHGNSKYADIVERAMYNGALSGVSLYGDKFFYDNPLQADGTHHRVPWYDCSCCPTQISRFIPSIGNYVYAVDNDDIYVNQYIAGTAVIKLHHQDIRVRQITEYPWEGCISVKIEECRKETFAIHMRIPGWCNSYQVQVNGKANASQTQEQGYIVIRREWQAGDEVRLELTMPVERIHAHPLVKANQGKVALQRGPLVYCMEETDNRDYDAATIHPSTKFQAVFENDLLEGVVALYGASTDNSVILKLIPYYAWENREAGKMQVWISEYEDETRLYRD